MKHRKPQDFGDRCALFFTMRLRWFADTFFAKPYVHRAVVIETVVVFRHGCVCGIIYVVYVRCNPTIEVGLKHC